MLLKTTTDSPTSNLDSSKTPHDDTSDSQSASTLNTSDIHKHITKKLLQIRLIQTHPHKLLQILKNKTKHIIMDIDAISHLPSLCIKIVQELNLNGLCQYCNSHQAYVFKNSNHLVNCSNILVFLRQSMCYFITPIMHQWYKISANKILENRKLALCDDNRPTLYQYHQLNPQK